MVVGRDPFGSVESVKAASDVYAPVSGEIVESNTVRVMQRGERPLARMHTGGACYLLMLLVRPGDTSVVLECIGESWEVAETTRLTQRSCGMLSLLCVCATETGG